MEDRRVLNGIIFINIFINRSALRWCNASAGYDPPKTLYNRRKRWSDTGVFTRTIMGLAEHPPR